MEVKFNVTGARRKKLAQTIAEIVGTEAEYKGTPTFAYVIDCFTVTKDGTLEFPDNGDTESMENVLHGLSKSGFEYEMPESSENDEDADEQVGLTISVPTDKVNVENLTKLLNAKGELIKKALGIDALPVEVGEDAVSFPWFSKMPDADSAAAYTHLISALCRMSCEQKRITATAKDVENEKYAFRCFLLRLGFIGTEYKTERKILLRNLSGSSAFKGGARDADAE